MTFKHILATHSGYSEKGTLQVIQNLKIIIIKRKKYRKKKERLMNRHMFCTLITLRSPLKLSTIFQRVRVWIGYCYTSQVTSFFFFHVVHYRFPLSWCRVFFLEMRGKCKKRRDLFWKISCLSNLITGWTVSGRHSSLFYAKEMLNNLFEGITSTQKVRICTHKNDKKLTFQKADYRAIISSNQR